MNIPNLAILFKVYCKENISQESIEIYENFLEANYPAEYADFLDFKRKVEHKTPNIKDLVFDWMDGKGGHPDFELFDVYND